MFRPIALRGVLTTIALTAGLSAAEPGALSPERLKEYLRQYPEADTNGDGILSPAEARAYWQKLRGAKAGKAAKAAPAPPAEGARGEASLPPTHADVAYGPHARNVLDFWQARSDLPTPLVMFIHGGGFTSGDKSKVGGRAVIQPYLDAGVSFAAINYRYRSMAPIQDVLRDCARAIQFLRHQASAWNLDKSRVAAYGGSAGAGTSLWLAFHDDLADPANPDPVLRESTRLVCAGANSTQFSYDILRWPELFGEEVSEKFGEGTDLAAFYGLASEAELRGITGARLRADCDMFGLITPDDPPVFLATKLEAGPITTRGEFLHHPKHAQAILERCEATGVPALADLPGLGIRPPESGPTQLRDFLLLHLLAPRS
jgi:hypothetical protein